MSIRKSAFLLMINLGLLLACLVAAYYGAAAMLWQADVLKLSFLLFPLYFITAFAIAMDWISEDLADKIEGRLPMIALCGTVYGIILVFDSFGQLASSSGSVKSLIVPVMHGGGTAMWPTFLALVGSNLLWGQLLIRGSRETP